MTLMHSAGRGLLPLALGVPVVLGVLQPNGARAANKTFASRETLEAVANERQPRFDAARSHLGASAVLGEATPMALPTGGDKTGVSSQAISVPQGAGKLQGMGESFSTQLSTGVATFSVPFAMPKARGAVQPSLTLTYSSGGGHGIAGVGWDVGWSYIARQTDRGLPLYDDRAGWHPQQDRFVFNGGQELVPICDVHGLSCGGALPDEVMPAWADGWQYFRSRVEQAYLRFFWSPDHRTWRVQSKTGETLELGAPLDGSGYAGALESDPHAAQHLFRWNVVRQYDDEGAGPPAATARPEPANAIVYRYTNSAGIAYLSDIYSTPPAANPTLAPLASYAHHVRLRYETRPDATLSFRRGWRVDQTWRLVGVDVASAPFGAPGAARRAVRRYHLAYDPDSHASLLTSVQLEGRCAGLELDAPAENENEALPTTSCPSLPPMKFGYQHVASFKSDGTPTAPDLVGYEGFDERVISMSGSPPNSVDEDATDLFDIDSDSLPDVVVTTPNSSARFPMYLNSAGGAADTFAASSLGVVGALGASATSIRLQNDNLAVLDVDGDGTVDWVHQPAPRTYAVYSPRALADGWSMVGAAVPAAAQEDPRLDLGDDTPDMYVFDANGDGLVDVVRSTETELQTSFSLGRYPGGAGKFGAAKWTAGDAASLSFAPVRSCVPLVAPGVPVRFSDGAFRLGDMNGDGLTDIVYLARGDIRYWPGRGDGSWGTSDLGSCTSGGSERTFLSMTPSPQFSDPNGQGLRLDDVNGDGLADLVQLRFDGIDIWLNVDGTAFTAQRHIIGSIQQTQGPTWAAKVRIADVNGSGTPDILWGEGGRYRYIDLQGGARPWLLTHVENGLGKTTDIAYASSSALMLAAAANKTPWATRLPMPVHVVTSTTERDNLEIAGRPAGQYVTEYSYRDPVYDGRQREFRGFRTEVTKRWGDGNSPSSLASSEFLLGECADDEAPPAGATSRCSAEGRWADNPREALKGLPVVTETYDENGVYQSSTHKTYTLRKLYSGLDGREVRTAFEGRTDTWTYDLSAFTRGDTAGTLPDVVLDAAGGSEPSVPQPFAIRTADGTAHTRSTREVDVFGNDTRIVDEGCVDGAACASPDESIATVKHMQLVDRQGGAWLWRVDETSVQGADGVARKHVTTSYDGSGHPIATYAVLAGTATLARFHETGAAVAQPSSASSHDGTIWTGATAYDAFGQPKSVAAPNGHCRDIAYAGDYADFATSETIYAGAPGGACAAGGGARGATALTTQASYDRGLGLITGVVDPRGGPSRVTYDDIGRFTSLTQPSAAGRVLSAQPSVIVDYDVATPARPYSIVHTRAVVGANEDDAIYNDAYGYFDGLTRPMLTIADADPAAGDGGTYLVQGLTQYDAKGAQSRVYLEWFWDGDPRAYPLAGAPLSLYTRHRYDAFGHEVQSFGLDGMPSAQLRYHALSVDTWDAADLGTGPHAGTYASTAKDGHGRTVAHTERARVGGALEARVTRTTFLATGEATTVVRSRRNGNDDDVVRSVQYDTLGRMVQNSDPDAKASWRYAYDDGGDLVGFSDPRGCGANYEYDLAGRIRVEDYSPCLASQDDYSAPNAVSGDGAEVYYQYDSADASITSIPGVSAGQGGSLSVDECALDPGLLLGKLVARSDRAGQVVSSFDGRGQPVCVARRVAKPGKPREYAATWYSQRARYDAAGRPVSMTTGARYLVDPASGQSTVTTAYTRRGLVKSVDSSYGALVSSIVRDADGRTTRIAYGDAASTTTTMSYDARRRLANAQTSRGRPALWSTSTPTYSAPDATTSQLLLEDVDFHYDAVDNPVEATDWRVAAEWSPGALPATRKMQYDDENRVIRVDYAYAAGSDAWSDPFAAEEASAGSNPKARPHLVFANRPLWQSYQYDWLGNVVMSDDDAKGFHDRSAGAIAHGTPTDGPYQVRSAHGGAAPRDGAMTTRYDAAGELVGLAIAMNPQAPCVGGGECSIRYAYDWDELGRLVHARRWDGASRGLPTDPLPDTSPDADLRYAYDAGDARVLKSAADASGKMLHTVYLGDLELRRTTFEEDDYVRSLGTEAVYLRSHGTRLARVFYAADDVPTLSSGKLHVLLELADHLGSTSSIVDRETGELVEASAYQGYGAIESDYRPTRWGAYREPYGFTGKEEDIEVGLVYFGARYLSPGLMTWISPDPKAIHELGADPNVYAYVRGRVFTAVDAVGLADNGLPPNAVVLDRLPSTVPVNGAPTYVPQGSVKTYTMDASLYPETAAVTQAYLDANNASGGMVGIKLGSADRDAARAFNLRGIPTAPGMDRHEAFPASVENFINEENAVAHVTRSDNQLEGSAFSKWLQQNNVKEGDVIAIRTSLSPPRPLRLAANGAFAALGALAVIGEFVQAATEDTAAKRAVHGAIAGAGATALTIAGAAATARALGGDAVLAGKALGGSLEALGVLGVISLTVSDIEHWNKPRHFVGFMGLLPMDQVDIFHPCFAGKPEI